MSKPWTVEEQSFGCWGEEIVVRTYVRFVAGACVLVVALLMVGAGAAIAVAAPHSGLSGSNGNSGSSSHGNHGAGSNPAGNRGHGPVGGLGAALRRTVQAITGTLGSGLNPGQQPATAGQTAQKPQVGAVPNLATPVADVLAAIPNVVAPLSDLVAQVPSVVAAPVSAVEAQVPNVLTPVADAVAQVPGVFVAPPGDVVAQILKVVTPVADAVAQVPGVFVAPVSALAAQAPGIVTLLTNVVAPIAQLPSEVSSWFGNISGNDQVLTFLLGIDGAVVSPAADASAVGAPPVAPQLPAVLPVAGIPGAPLAGSATEVPTGPVIVASTVGATTELGRESSLPGTEQQASDSVIPIGVRSFLRQAYSDIVRSPSLSALAAVALPGVAGLMILTGAGVRFGYRQAKAGIAVRAAGIARFAVPGPMDVVRPIALRVVRPGAFGGVRPMALSAGRLLDKAA
jgi:hypothetical protein